MGETAGSPGFRALVYEPEALVGERVRQMLHGEGFRACLVDDLDLFGELGSQLDFDLYAAGLSGVDELEGLRPAAELRPLLLLVPSARSRSAAPYRLAFPDAILVDRALRDPDALRLALGTAGPPEPAPPPDAVRRAFVPFRLSERQLEVLSSALMGRTSRQIASKLFISELTVRNHLHAIYERVGVSGRRELLGRFVQGLIEGSA